MRKSKASDRARPSGHAGEGAASALKEMLRRQAGNPTPGTDSSNPVERERDPPRSEPRPPSHRSLH
jgi:hypothetical protein